MQRLLNKEILNNLDLLNGGRLIPESEGEREREVARLQDKFRDVIKRYQYYRSQLPWSYPVAQRLIKKRAQKELMKKTHKKPGRKGQQRALRGPPPIPPLPPGIRPPAPGRPMPYSLPERRTKGKTRKYDDYVV